MQKSTESIELKIFDSTQRSQAWLIVLGFALLTAFCLFFRLGKFLNLAFPIGALIIGLLVYRKCSAVYLEFAWWLWFLTPWVRRVVDLQSGWTDPSPILLAPMLVSAITGITFLKYFPRDGHRNGLPFTLCATSVVYSLLVGLISNASTGAILGFLGWIDPILMGFYMFVNWRSYPNLAESMRRVFLWGTVVMGSYGVIQFLIAPEWDKYWLTQVNTPAFGNPEPLGIRVFSTMNAPQPFAAVMVAGLILLFCNKGFFQLLGAGSGYLSLLLSTARSAWISWAVALLLFLPLLKSKLQIRIILSILVVFVLLIPLFTIESFSTTINARLDTFSNVQNDTSYSDRLSGYTELTGLALTQVLGMGMGYEIVSSSLGSRDSGLLSMLFSLGWIGTLPYLSGMFLLFAKLLQGVEGRSDLFLGAAAAIALGSFAQIGVNVATAGSLGMVLWGFLGIGLAGKQYYQHTAKMAG